jgi:hypothetical protein
MEERKTVGSWLAALCMVVFLLTAFAAGAWAESPDYGNSISTATEINVNSSKAGIIGYRGDWDYFRILVPFDGTLTVYTTGSTDTYGSLKDFIGTDLASNDDSGSMNFRISQSVSAGIHYVAVRHHSSTGRGAYTLYATFAASVQPPAPTLILPANGSTDVSRGTFQWSSSLGATNYRIVISQNSSFSGFNETSMRCEGSCVTAEFSETQCMRYLPSGHTYYWRVRANGPSGTSGWSDAWQFSTPGI